jgi:hypothetical protein
VGTYEQLYKTGHYAYGRGRGCGIYPPSVYGYVWDIKKCGDNQKPVREGAG